MSSYAKKSLNGGKTQLAINNLWYKISQEEKEKYNEPKTNKIYGATLLQGYARRMQAFLRKQAAHIQLSLNLNSDSNT